MEGRRLIIIRRPYRQAAARAVTPEQEETRAEQVARRSLEPHIDEMCWEWARWEVTRKFYGVPPPPSSVLAQFGRDRIRSTAPGQGPNAVASAVLQRFHQAIVSADDFVRAAFEGYYLHRVRPIKKLAAMLVDDLHPNGVDRTHVYYLRSQLARKAYSLATK